MMETSSRGESDDERCQSAIFRAVRKTVNSKKGFATSALPSLLCRQYRLHDPFHRVLAGLG